MSYVKLDPYNWPQDTLAIPAGQGRMPPLNKGNVELSRRESFTATTRIDIPANQPAGTIFRAVIPTDQDGDFWCNQIYVEGQEVNAGVAREELPLGRVMIRDIRTGWALTYPTPGVSLRLLAARVALFELVSIDLQQVTFPAGYRPTGTLIQPFCFTRDGGIEIIYTTDGAGEPLHTYELSFSFAGWKEYVYASR